MINAYSSHSPHTLQRLAPTARRMPMSLVFSRTIAQKIARIRNDTVIDTTPRISSTITISFFTAPTSVACSSSHVVRC